jgi:hypothetical protein
MSFLQDYDVDVSDTTMVTVKSHSLLKKRCWKSGLLFEYNYGKSLTSCYKSLRGRKPVAQARDTMIVTHCFHNNFVNFLNQQNIQRFS